MDKTNDQSVMYGIALETTPERYIRVNITKNSRGYSYETTVGLRWIGDVNDALEVRGLLARADKEARLEIARREALDAEGDAQ